MALPGLGTMVRYHITSAVSIPGVVLGTSDSWTSDLTAYYGATPSTGNIAVLTWLDSSGDAGIQAWTNVAEGTSVGQFSLLIMEAEDQ